MKNKNLEKNKKKFNYDFRGKTVLVVGASRGIGFGIAKSYVKLGADLMICSKNLSKIKKSYQKLNKFKKKNQQLFYTSVDVSIKSEVKSLIRLTLKKLSKIDIIISNAGIYGPRGSIESVSWAQWVNTIKVNLFGPIFLCREIIPYFKKNNKGKIIQLSGGGVAGPLPRISGYAISKIAVARFMENLSEEVKDFSIDINVVAPGAINTDMLEEIIKEGPKNIGDYYYKKALKQKKLGGSSLKKACDLILFLSSEHSNGITGKILSALWDNWKILSRYKKILRNSDIYTLKRINPKDRGFSWGAPKSKIIYDTLFSPFNKKKFFEKLNLLKNK